MRGRLRRVIDRDPVRSALRGAKRILARDVIDGRPVRVARGWRLHLNPHDRVGLLHYLAGDYEAVELRVAQTAIRPGSIAFDVGANIGYWSLELSRMVGPRGRVYAFEPEPENFQILLANLRLNGASNVTPVPIALSNAHGDRRLFRSRSNAGDYSFGGVDDARDSVVVPCGRMDQFCEQYGCRPDFLKVDVQGHELEVFEGARGLGPGWTSQVRAVVEFDRDSLTRSRVDAAEFLGRLQALGFDLRPIRKRGPMDPISTGGVAPFSTDPRNDRLNLFLDHAPARPDGSSS